MKNRLIRGKFLVVLGLFAIASVFHSPRQMLAVQMGYDARDMPPALQAVATKQTAMRPTASQRSGPLQAGSGAMHRPEVKVEA